MVELTQEQKDHFNQLKIDMVRQIYTEPGLTDQQIADTIKLNNKSNDPNYYHFLRQQLPSALAAAKYLEGLTRRTKDRVSEAARAERHTTPTSNIKNKLGLSQSSSEARVKQELKRLSTKSDATWRALGLNKSKTLKYYGIE